MSSLSERNKIITTYYNYINITGKKYCNLYKITKKEDREDAIQDCFVKIIDGLDRDQFDLNKSDIKTWIDRVIKHCIINLKKKTKDEESLKESQIDFNDNQILDKIIFDKFLEQLSDVEKQIVLFKKDGYNNKEISLKMGLSLDNVRQIYCRIKKNHDSPI